MTRSHQAWSLRGAPGRDRTLGTQGADGQPPGPPHRSTAHVQEGHRCIRKKRVAGLIFYPHFLLFFVWASPPRGSLFCPLVPLSSEGPDVLSRFAGLGAWRRRPGGCLSPATAGGGGEGSLYPSASSTSTSAVFPALDLAVASPDLCFPCSVLAGSDVTSSERPFWSCLPALPALLTVA